MNKKLSLVAVLCCALALCISLAGCGPNKSNFTGNWALESGNDATLDADSIALMKTLGLQVILTLDEDETGKMHLFGETHDATWKATSDTEGEITIDGNQSTLTLADDKLTLTDPEGKYLTFEKYDGEIPSDAAASAASSSSAAAVSASAAATSESATSASATAADSADADSSQPDDGAVTTDSTNTTLAQSEDDQQSTDDSDDQLYYEQQDDGTSDDEGEYYEEPSYEEDDGVYYADEQQDDGEYYEDDAA